MADGFKTVVTADAAITIGGKDILLVRRAKEPCKGLLAMPGGHMEDGDWTCMDTCVRELKEETGLVLSPQTVTVLTVLSEKNRDPRGRYVTVVYHKNVDAADVLDQLQAGDDAHSVHVHPLAEIQPSDMAFDHYTVIALLKQKYQV